MCISATVLAIASVVTSAAGAAVSIASANAQASAQQQQLQLQQEQLKAERENQLMQTQQAEIARLKEFNKQRASNLASLASMGLGMSMSYLQGTEKAEEQALRMDLSNLRLGYLTGSNRIADEIRVNRLSSQVVNFNKNAAIVGAGLSVVQSGINAANYVKTYNTPKSPSPTGTGQTIVGGGS
jgi:hypothetical protein